MTTYPSTARFSISRNPRRDSTDRVLEVMYQATPDAQSAEFAHVWAIQGWDPKDEGKWTFNRSHVAIAHQWWIGIPVHDTLADLLNHLEATFVEGVPANRPRAD